MVSIIGKNFSTPFCERGTGLHIRFHFFLQLCILNYLDCDHRLKKEKNWPHLKNSSSPSPKKHFQGNFFVKEFEYILLVALN